MKANGLLVPLVIQTHQLSESGTSVFACPYLLITYSGSVIRQLIPTCYFWRRECASLHVFISSGRSRSGSLSVWELNVWSLPLISLQWTHWCSRGQMANKWLICVHAGNIWWRFPLHILPARCIKLSFNKSWWMTHTTLLPVLELEEILEWGEKSTLQKAWKINNI